jgi:type IX secretion system PorP/SprF family membrane protein
MKTNSNVWRKGAGEMRRQLLAGTFFTFLAGLMPQLCKGQADVHFSQFYESSILRNPALTGVFADDYKVGVYYRKQWASISHPFETAMLSAETRVSVSSNSEDFCSFGLLGYSDKAGSIDQKITTFYPAINYNKSLNPDNNSYLSVGFTGGYMQYSFDPDKATFNNQFMNGFFDRNNPSLENLPIAKMSMWDLGAGITYNASKGENNMLSYVIGFAGYHFTQPKFSYYPNVEFMQNMRWNGNMSISCQFTENLLGQGHINYAQQGKFREIVAGGLMSYTTIKNGLTPEITVSAGLFYRYNDALIPLIKLKYKRMSMGISYDINVSSLKQASKMAGGYELTLFFTGNYSDKGIYKKTVCPKF